jgi:GABA permease
MNTSSHHLLVIANLTATNEALVVELRRRQHAGPVVVHLVVAALNTRARHWLSDIDDATRAAHARVDEALSVMRDAGITLTAEAGDGDPLSATADALAEFPADEILICTLPVERSHWLERDIIGRAKSSFPVPVAHIIATDQPGRSEDLVGVGHSAS